MKGRPRRPQDHSSDPGSSRTSSPVRNTLQLRPIPRPNSPISSPTPCIARKLHPSVTFAALILLQRLKVHFPTARGSSGHRLFISAFMIASKVICDDTYSNKSWGIAAQGMFPLREINQMECKMCNYLDWELTIDNPILSNFEKLVTKDFSQDRPSFPNYPLVIVSKRAAASTTATPVPEPSVTTTAIPNFGQHRRPSSASQPNPPPPLQQNHTPHRSS
ncbi:hypothetical protein FA13DRAFT_1812031 [Coprinellus micaceus]|uniref:Cyclin N-terminal domain-containing protein n=1 Tax=Coprinellus micaceus TaxID=71717 RepID=A0A4Y7TIJ9_COPMI|nr:hypothetical protein FA13DRAFT_1812031 [Coprinellus micaceus]